MSKLGYYGQIRQLIDVERQQDEIISFCHNHELFDSNFLACTLTSSSTHNYKDFEQQKEYLYKAIKRLNVSTIVSLEFDEKQRYWHLHFIAHQRYIKTIQQLNTDNNLDLLIINGYDLKGWIDYITIRTFDIFISKEMDMNKVQPIIKNTKPYAKSLTAICLRLLTTILITCTTLKRVAEQIAHQRSYKACIRYLYASPPV